MKSRVLLLGFGLSALLALTACPPSYPNCNDTEDCNEDGHSGVCVDGLCQECGVDSDCKAGFRCERGAPGQARCVPAGCQSNSDCSGGRICQNGACIACQADNECGANARCRSGGCVPFECSTDEDCGGNRICVENLCEARPQPPKCEIGPVRFGFNEATLGADARGNLEQLVSCIQKTQPNAEITIEGHADERGTEEYNLSLGERRANAVKKYLVNLGLRDNQLRTVSYGEERPLSRASTEDAWTQNRRAEFVITNP